MAKVTTITGRYQRTRNGAWIGAGSDKTEVEVSDTDAPAYLMRTHRGCTVTVTFDDGEQVGVSTYNDPVSGFGRWGPLGRVVGHDMLVQMHPRCGNVARSYYRCILPSDEQVASFAEHHTGLGRLNGTQ